MPQSPSTLEQPAPEVSAALERIIASEAFTTAPGLCRFLRFVVDETLAGRGDALKEYTIAVEALGRPPGFDPATNSTVRVAARLVRFKLQEYYAEAGRADNVVISLPKGRYAPTFSRRVMLPAEQGVGSSLPTAPNRRSGRLLVVALLVATLVGIGLWQPWRRFAALPAPAVLAVLPFANLTGESAEDFVSDGLADEVTSAIGSNPGLRVIARTSAWKFKDSHMDVRDVARTLGATHVIEGSLLKAAGRYRVSLQLNSGADGASLWVQQFEVDRRDVFGIYDTIAQAVQNAVGAHLNLPTASSIAPRASGDAVANAQYLEGRYYWNQRTTTSLQRAESLFQQAVERRPGFAAGWAGLASVLATMEVNHVSKPGVSAARAIPAAERAIALDPTLGEPWATIGLLRGFVEWRWSAADTAFRHAIALSPNNAIARSWYSNTLLARGHVDDALRQLETARQLDPVSAPLAYLLAQANYYGRRWDAGLIAINRHLELAPNSTFGLTLKGKLLKGAGRTADAAQVFVQSGDSIELALLKPLQARRGDVLRLVRKLPPDVRDRGQFWIATIFAQVGEVDSAFSWLERAFRARQADLASLKTDPMIDPVKGDPRYRALLIRIGLDSL